MDCRIPFAETMPTLRLPVENPRESVLLNLSRSEGWIEEERSDYFTQPVGPRVAPFEASLGRYD